MIQVKSQIYLTLRQVRYIFYIIERSYDFIGGTKRDVVSNSTNSFDQEEILFLVQGLDQSIKRNLRKGFLEGDPAGG